ncbi:hypothetical protein BDW74DRAFT_183278 [Aspergillus multicolor]|uniref:uncharacterized protein n=1 Tax=Aspergillus multicolor TaxID=41759 RepID=UPI003CCD2951
MSAESTDPFLYLNYDCTYLLLEYLNIHDLAYAQQVCKLWHILVREWIAGPALRLHFPDVWEDIREEEVEREIVNFESDSDIQRDIYEEECTKKERRLAKFNVYAADQACDERWENGILKRIYNYPLGQTLGNMFTTAGDFIAWPQEETVFWQPVGKPGQECGSDAHLIPYPHPVKRLNIDVRRYNVHFIRVHAKGLLLLVVYVPEERVYREHLFHLETGKELWVKQQDEELDRPYPVAMGREKLYLYHNDTRRGIDTYDLHTGTLIASQPTIFPNEDFDHQHTRIWRLSGRNVLVAVSFVNTRAYHQDALVHFTEPETGELLDTVLFRHPIGLDPRDVKLRVSSRLNEYAFALIYDYDFETGKFMRRGRSEWVHVGDLGVTPADDLDYDPFRRVLVVAGARDIFPRIINFDEDPGEFDIGQTLCLNDNSNRQASGVNKVIMDGSRLYVCYESRGEPDAFGRKWRNDTAVLEFGTGSASSPQLRLDGEMCLHPMDSVGDLGRTKQSDHNILDGEQKALQLFKELAYEDLFTAKFRAGKPVRAINYPPPLGALRVAGAGEFLAWRSKFDCIYYQRLGHKVQDGSVTLHPVEELDFKVRHEDILVFRVHPSGRLYLVALRDAVHTEHMFDLETGNQLWSRRLPPYTCLFALGLELPIVPLVEMGWDRLYRYGDEAEHLEAYDIRTGTLFYSVPQEVDLGLQPPEAYLIGCPPICAYLNPPIAW